MFSPMPQKVSQRTQEPRMNLSFHRSPRKVPPPFREASKGEAVAPQSAFHPGTSIQYVEDLAIHIERPDALSNCGNAIHPRSLPRLVNLCEEQTPRARSRTSLFLLGPPVRARVLYRGMSRSSPGQKQRDAAHCPPIGCILRPDWRARFERGGVCFVSRLRNSTAE